MVTHRFTHELELALRTEQPAIRRDAVATLARIMRQEGPPSDRALATLWLYHLANHDPDEKVRTMAAVPIRLTAVWSEELQDKLYAPEFEVRLDAAYTLQKLMETGGHEDATMAHRWLAWLAGHDPNEEVRRAANHILGWDIDLVERPRPAPPRKAIKRISRKQYRFGVIMAVIGIIATFIGLPLFLISKFPHVFFGVVCIFACLFWMGMTLYQMRQGYIATKQGNVRGLWMLLFAPIWLCFATLGVAGGITAVSPNNPPTGTLLIPGWIGVVLIGYILSAPYTFVPAFKRFQPVYQRCYDAISRVLARKHGLVIEHPDIIEWR